MSQSDKTVLITGVSTGIGYGIAKEAVRRGWQVFGSVRKADDAERVQSDLGSQFTPLIFDVTNDDQILEAVKYLNELLEGKGLSCLINNSGIAIGGPILHQPMEDIERQFEVNVFGLLRVTRAFAKLLGAQADAHFPPGRIINISSVGGKIASPFVAAYVGTKHAVEGISASLRRELLLYGIDVIVVGPGAVKTPIWKKGIHVDDYRSTDYRKVLDRFGRAAMNGAEKGLSIEDVGGSICDIMEKRQPNTRYALVPQPLANWYIPRLLPDRWIDRYIRKNLFKK